MSRRHFLVDQLFAFDDHFPVSGWRTVFGGHAAGNPVPQGFDDLFYSTAHFFERGP
jgi:hypothetical protein